MAGHKDGRRRQGHGTIRREHSDSIPGRLLSDDEVSVAEGHPSPVVINRYLPWGALPRHASLGSAKTAKNAGIPSNTIDHTDLGTYNHADQPTDYTRRSQMRRHRRLEFSYFLCPFIAKFYGRGRQYSAGNNIHWERLGLPDLIGHPV